MAPTFWGVWEGNSDQPVQENASLYPHVIAGLTFQKDAHWSWPGLGAVKVPLTWGGKPHGAPGPSGVVWVFVCVFKFLFIDLRERKRKKHQIVPLSYTFIGCFLYVP